MREENVQNKKTRAEIGGYTLDLCQSREKKGWYYLEKVRNRKRIKDGFEDMAIKEIVT
jgi:hypothetical protein